jgi:hypothetical protein
VTLGVNRGGQHKMRSSGLANQFRVMSALPKWAILRSLQFYKSARRLVALERRTEPLVNTTFIRLFGRQPQYPAIRLFRGVSKDHYSYFFAGHGVIIPQRPILGHKNAISHNHGLYACCNSYHFIDNIRYIVVQDLRFLGSPVSFLSYRFLIIFFSSNRRTKSIFTSWSRNMEMAEIHAGANDAVDSGDFVGTDCGVVAEALVDPSRMVYSDDIYQENEVRQLQNILQCSRTPSSSPSNTLPFGLLGPRERDSLCR